MSGKLSRPPSTKRRPAPPVPEIRRDGHSIKIVQKDQSSSCAAGTPPSPPVRIILNNNNNMKEKEVGSNSSNNNAESVTAAGYVVSIAINGAHQRNGNETRIQVGHNQSSTTLQEDNISDGSGGMACVRIRVGGGGATQDYAEASRNQDPYYYFGQDAAMDSGVCSDHDGSTPPPIPRKDGSLTSNSGDSYSDEDSDGESNISTDSLNPDKPPPLPPKTKIGRDNLLIALNERTYLERNTKKVLEPPTEDRYLKFHLNENQEEGEQPKERRREEEVDDIDASFAGVRHLTDSPTDDRTILSTAGTIRGVKNRVRAGIATFLQQNTIVKSFVEKEHGKVVVYVTTMGVIRDTYLKCQKVRQILRTLLIKYEERDVYMSKEVQQEIRERMGCDTVSLPHLFLEGRHLGDSDTIERLNESGELRKLLRPYKTTCNKSTCEKCGGFRLLPCPVCSGSKKSVHRNHFTAEFVALKCMHCDEAALVRCNLCNDGN